tara:strand:+ start:234 stop:389 length:156 start_codon:yes stop_codon:yes gene_type:complete
MREFVAKESGRATIAIRKGILECAVCHEQIKNETLGPVLCSNCKNEVIKNA